MSTPGAQPTDVRAPAGIDASTIVQKVVHPALAELYLGNVTVPGRFEPHRAAGFVVRGGDVTAERADEFAEAFGMDKVPGWPLGGPLYLLRFPASSTLLFTTTFGGQTPEAAQLMNTHVVYPAPFLGTGYTPSAHPVPEYFLELAELPAGAELWRVDPFGEQVRVGKYVHRQIGWIPTGGVDFGPGRWYRAPAPLRPTVRRGLVVRFEGQDFDADFGPNPGELTLHPLPGQPAPAGFEEREGTRFRVIADVQAETVHHLRQLTSWRGAPFELVDVVGDRATLNFLGENYQVADALDLVEVDFRVWRAVVPRAELGEIREDLRVVPRGLFGSN